MLKTRRFMRIRIFMLFSAVLVISVFARCAFAEEGFNITFASDVHNQAHDYRIDSANSSSNRVYHWLNAIAEMLGRDIDIACFNGDHANESAKSNDDYWKLAGQVIEAAEHAAVKQPLFIPGNHEYKVDDGNMSEYTGAPEYTQKMKGLGTVIRNDAFEIFCFGATGNRPWGFEDSSVDKLEAYLHTAPVDKPIIIIAHFPLHVVKSKSGSGSMVINSIKNNERIIDVLNKYGEYKDIYYIWGHSHYAKDIYYDRVLDRGETIKVYDSKGKGRDIPINFVYASDGCMSDEEYHFVWCYKILGKGLLMHIDDSGVEMSYYDKNYALVGNVFSRSFPKGSLTLSETEVGMYSFDRRPCKLTYSFSEDAEQTEVTFHSLDEEVATVTPSGEVYAQSPGVTEIFAVAQSGLVAHCYVTVEEMPLLELSAVDIEEEAFEGNRSFVTLEIAPGESTRIAARSFKDCSSLSTAYIPENVAYIGEDAFLGCAEDFTIVTPKGSTAMEYAIENSITWAEQ